MSSSSSTRPAPSALPRPAMTSAIVVLILAALLGIQPITTDLYLPALPALTTGFGAGMGQAQLTLTGLLLAFGVSQLVWGPLSDHYGRRPVLLVGLCAYCVAAVGSAMSLTGGTAMGLFAYLGLSGGPHGAWYVTLPFYLFMLGHGIHQPCGQSGAVGPFPRFAGAAAALNGFGMMLVAFAVGGWLGTRMDGTVFPLTNGIWFWGVVIAASGWTLVQKYGDIDHGPAPTR